MAIAERWKREAKHLAPTLHLQNREAVLDAFVTATQKAVAGEMTEAPAREVLDRILEATGLELETDFVTPASLMLSETV